MLLLLLLLFKFQWKWGMSFLLISYTTVNHWTHYIKMIINHYNYSWGIHGLVDWLVFNADFSNISAISWYEFIDSWIKLYAKRDTKKKKLQAMHSIHSTVCLWGFDIWFPRNASQYSLKLNTKGNIVRYSIGNDSFSDVQHLQQSR